MIYEPAEDSWLIAKEVLKMAKGKRVLDVGTGSGVLALEARKAGAKRVLASDLSQEAVKLVRLKGIETIESDLLANVHELFDLIIFNPPYLPLDKRENKDSQLATTGGKEGDEIIIRFLKEVDRVLANNGVILLLISSLTPFERIKQLIDKKGFYIEILGIKKMFMEKLFVWKIARKRP